jgi:hypothetical protein
MPHHVEPAIVKREVVGIDRPRVFAVAAGGVVARGQGAVLGQGLVDLRQVLGGGGLELGAGGAHAQDWASASHVQ